MKLVFFCLLILHLFFYEVTPVNCQEYFVGTVVAMDAQKMEIEVEPQYPLQIFGAAQNRGNVIVRLEGLKNVQVRGRGGPFPDCVFPGNSIRLWGVRETSSERIFVVTDIRGCGGGGCQDSTGVRSRIRKLLVPDHNRDGVKRAGSREGRGGGRGNGNGGGGGGRK